MLAFFSWVAAIFLTLYCLLMLLAHLPRLVRVLFSLGQASKWCVSTPRLGATCSS